MLGGMTEIADRYRRLSDAFATTVAGVAHDQWDDPTPCEDWTVRDLLRHAVDTQGMFLGLVGRELGPIPSVDDAFRGSGVCGPEVLVSDDADIQTRTLAFYGRST